MAKPKNKTAAAVAVTVGLQAIVEATAKGAFVYTQPAEHQPLVAEGLVEVNPAISSEQGLATRATQKGIDYMAAGQKQNIGAGDVGSISATDLTGAKTKPSFKIEDNVAIPPVTGRGRTGESVYPFDQLQVGQSFFVPKESKNMASTISSANARYAEVIPGQTRKNRKGVDVPATRKTREFVVRSVTEGDVKGSRIWRKA